MSDREEFLKRCAAVSRENGWALSEKGFELSFGDGRSQFVALDFFEFEGAELVRLFSRIGGIKRIDPARLAHALRLNYGLPHGSLAVKDDELVMVDTLVVEDADPGEIEGSTLYLAETADQFEMTMFGADDH